MTLKNFEEFLARGIIKKYSPDRLRARDLLKNSDKTYGSVLEIVKKIGINEININTIIKESYDSIMESVRAKMFLEGFIAEGVGAHEAEISYLKKLNFDESDLDFLNRLRYFRNGIIYYGKKFDKEYAQKVLNFLKKFRNKLK